MIQAVCVALGVVLVSRIGTPRGAVREHVETHVRQDIAEGVRWLGGNKPVRTLALVIVAFNITWAAPWSVLVLWSLERVGMDEAGFGLLTTASALGGLLGTAAYGRVEKRVPLAALMRTVLACEVVFHLAHGADDVAVGGVPADVLLRRLRVHLGDAVAGRCGSGRCPRSSRGASARSTCCA